MNISQFALDHKVVRYSDEGFTLKSGQHSHWYVNWRPVTCNVTLLDQLASHILELISKLTHPDHIIGVPYGASKLGLICQYRWTKEYSFGSNILMYRPPKPHGDPNFTETITGDVVLIEDVITTGGSVLEFLPKIPEANVVGLVSLTDRGSPETFKKSLEENNIWYMPLTTMEDFNVS